MKTDLIERLRAHPSKFIGHWEDWANEADTLLREAAAALEAEASEGERRGLERAAEVADAIYRDWIAMRGEGRMSKLISQTYADMAFYIAGRIRALIPEAPAQPELASAAANQISMPEVGLPEATAEGWQTIATAPRDGTEIILYDRGTVGTGFYSEAPEARRAEAGWFWEDDRGNLLIAKNADPAHWMPLPSPPQDREEQ